MKKLNKTSFTKIPLFFLALIMAAGLQAQSDNILSVDGMDFGAGIVVMWETMDAPKSTQTFVIERALNADADFEKIGEIVADAKDDQKMFNFEDRELGLKLAYYRIRTLEENAGVESYSEVVPVKKDVINNFKIEEAEKIDENQYRINVVSVAEGELKFQLATNMGEVMLQQTFQMQVGENDYMVDLDAEADGAYVVSFQNESYTITKNFSKKSKKNNNVARKD